VLNVSHLSRGVGGGGNCECRTFWAGC
jgi:hypothetical protein